MKFSGVIGIFFACVSAVVVQAAPPKVVFIVAPQREHAGNLLLGQRSLPVVRRACRFRRAVAPCRYGISLRRWPLEADAPITAALPPGGDVPGATKAFRARPGAAIPVTSATLRLNGKDLEAKPVQPGDTAVTFTAQLTAGSHQLAPTFCDAAGNAIGAYYAIIQRLP